MARVIKLKHYPIELYEIMLINIEWEFKTITQCVEV